MYMVRDEKWKNSKDTLDAYTKPLNTLDDDAKLRTI